VKDDENEKSKSIALRLIWGRLCVPHPQGISEHEVRANPKAIDLGKDLGVFWFVVFIPPTPSQALTN